MTHKAIVTGHEYLLERTNPKTGFRETLNYFGSLRDKPAGWRVVRKD